MQLIKNADEYRIGYEILNILMESGVPDSHKRRKRVVALKRNLRQYAHRELGFERQIVRDYGMDGFISLERLPDDIKDLEEARQFFDEFMTYTYIPSAYDCTGQWFTTWFKVFERRGHFYAYHRVCVDV